MVRKVENKAKLSPASAGAWLSLATGKKRNKKIRMEIVVH